MEHYTATIPYTLAEKLKEKGMTVLIEQEWYPNGMPKAEKDCHKPMTQYGQVFDWLMSDKGIEVEVYLSMTRLDAAKNPVQKIYAWNVFSRHSEANGEEDEMTWHEAANAAIEKALELI